jgi:hypothetical protein
MPVDGFPSARASAPTGPFKPDLASLCFVDLFLNHTAPRQAGTGIASIQALPRLESAVADAHSEPAMN